MWFLPRYILKRCLEKLLSSYLVLNPSTFEIDLELRYPTVVFPTDCFEPLDKKKEYEDRVTGTRRRETKSWKCCWGARIALRHVGININFIEKHMTSLRIIKPSVVSIDTIELSWIWSMERKGNILKGWATRPALKVHGLNMRASIMERRVEGNHVDDDSRDDSSASGSDATNTNDPGVNPINCTAGGNANTTTVSAGNKPETSDTGIVRGSRIGRAWSGLKNSLKKELWSVIEKIITFLTLEIIGIEISLQMPPIDHFEKDADSTVEEESQKGSSISREEINTSEHRHSYRDKNQQSKIPIKKVHPIDIPKTEMRRISDHLKGMESKIGSKKRKVHDKFQRMYRRKSSDSKQDEELISESLDNDVDTPKESISVYLTCAYIFSVPQLGRQNESSKSFNGSPRKWQETQQILHEQREDLLTDRFSIGLLSINIIESDSNLEGDSMQNRVSGCILGPFSYSAILMHVPKVTLRPKLLAFNGRFDRNIQLHGRPIATFAESIINGHNDGIFVQATEAQITWIIRLFEDLSSSFRRSVQESRTPSVNETLQSDGTDPEISSEIPLADNFKETGIFLFSIPIFSISIILLDKIYIKTSKVKFTKNKLSTQAVIQTVNIFVGKDKVDSEGLFRAFSSRITVLLSSKKLEVFLHVIDALYIPGVLGLTVPLQKMVLCFEEGKLYVKLTSACEVLLIDNEPQRQSQQKDIEIKNDSSKIDLPFPLSISVASITFKRGERVTVFSDLNFVAEKTHTTFDEILFKTDLGNIQLDNLLQSVGVHCSGRFSSKGPIDTVHDLEFVLGPTFCMKGFSLDDWDGCLLPRFWSDSQPFQLPFAKISALNMRVCVKAGVISNDDHVLKIGRFIGDHNTTTIDVKNHFFRRGLTNVPKFLTGVNIFGRNVTDQSKETLIMITPLGPFGGLMTFMAVDATKDIIKRGKQRRGVDADDPYKPGDFFRGLKTAKEEIEEGELKLGVATVHYFRNNKPQLAGAIAFCAVTPFGGPVAGIAAAVVVSSLVRLYLKKLERDNFENSVDEYWNSKDN